MPVQEPSTKKKRFTKEEDALIKKLIEEKRCASWDEVAIHVPGRTGRQCRDRYNSYLFNEIKNTKRWTEEEDQKLIRIYKEIGPRWVKISAYFKDRTGNQIKNRWHKGLAKYHGISHNIVRQERRSKMVKFHMEKEEPVKKENKPKIESANTIVQENDMDMFDMFFNNFGDIFC